MKQVSAIAECAGKFWSTERRPDGSGKVGGT